jgi:hypothetical protein
MIQKFPLLFRRAVAVYFVAAFAGFSWMMIAAFLRHDMTTGLGFLSFLVLIALSIWPQRIELTPKEIRLRSGCMIGRRLSLNQIRRVTAAYQMGGISFRRENGLLIEGEKLRIFAAVEDPDGLRRALLQASPQLRAYGDELRAAPESV